MPLYEYVCDKCTVEFEKFHLMKEDCTGDPCDQCQTGRLHRRFSLSETAPSRGHKGHRPGDVVKQFINDSSRDLKKERKRLKERQK